MKFLFCFLFVLVFNSISIAQNNDICINYKFATKEEACKILTTEDSYVKRWTKFDIEGRLQKTSGTKQDLLELISKVTLDWTDVEKEKTQRIIKSIEDSIRKNNFKLQFPSEIILIKTTMQEEFDAGGYTRGNCIVLGEKNVQYRDPTLQWLLTHELFHILTRYNQNFRKKMYSLIGFTIVSPEIEFPEDLRDRLISNPDIDKYDSYAAFTINGEKRKCAMILYSKKDYAGGSLTDYLNFGFIPLNNQMKLLQEDNNLLIYNIEDVSGFYEQVGNNTQYIIHPEEILAENFVHAILNNPDLPNPEIKQNIWKILQEGY